MKVRAAAKWVICCAGVAAAFAAAGLHKARTASTQEPLGDPSGNAVQPETMGGAVQVSGDIPAGLPHQLLVGLFESAGGTWMQNSKVPWDVRYAYATFGWLNNWGYGPPDGQWASSFFQECDAQRVTPAIAYYVMNGQPGGGESAFLQKAQNAQLMAAYFAAFKTLLERVRDYGKPVLILVEADGFGFLEQQSKHNPSAPAAVASTGLRELAALPNTVAGWSLAFLQLRKAVGAPNAVLGMHISAWAGGSDLSYFAVTEPLQPAVDKVYEFLQPLGLGANQTGATYDLLVGDPLDRDSNFYLLKNGENRWWDPSETASINSRSFNRYAEWLRLWNRKAGKRWVLWQIPLGNQWSRDVPNDGSLSAGWKDNRTEYFLGTDSRAHLGRWAQSGVIALLFGAGAPEQSSYQNDNDSLGAPYLKGRAAQFYEAGGFPLK